MTTARRKPLYRPRNLFVLASLFVLALFLFAAYTLNRPLGRPGKYTADFERIGTEWQPKDGPNGFDLLVAAVAKQQTVVDAMIEARQAAGLDPYGGPRPFVLPFDPARPIPGSPPEPLNTIEDVGNGVAALAAAGVPDALDAAAGARRAVGPVPDAEVFRMLLPHLGGFRNLGRACTARMYFAAEAGDDAELVRAFEHGLAVARICCSQSSIIEHNSGFAIAKASCVRIRESLVAHPPLGDHGTKCIDSCFAALDRQTPLPSLSAAIECQRFGALDTAEWTHTDGGLGGGLYVPELTQKMLDRMESSPPGTTAPLDAFRGRSFARKSETIAKTNELFDALQAAAKLPRPQRRTAFAFDAAVRALPLQFDLIRKVVPSNMQRCFDESDDCTMQLAATRLMLHIERFRIRTGAYPVTLEDLVPAELAAPALIDPMTDQPFGYRRLDPATDSAGRGYLLYSFGADGIDNSGKSLDEAAAEQPGAKAEELKGKFDVIVNMPRPARKP